MLKQSLTLFAVVASAYLPFVPLAAQAEKATYYADPPLHRGHLMTPQGTRLPILPTD
jgi:hypothetical protein